MSEIIHLSKRDAQYARNQREKRAIERANKAFTRADRFERNRKIIAGATSAALFGVTIALVLVLIA